LRKLCKELGDIRPARTVGMKERCSQTLRRGRGYSGMVPIIYYVDAIWTVQELVVQKKELFGGTLLMGGSNLSAGQTSYRVAFLRGSAVVQF
jgi:hypothetical protein